MKSRERACFMCENVLSSKMSTGMVTLRLPLYTEGRSFSNGRFLWRGRIPALKGLTTSATGSALFICSRCEAMAGGQ